MRLRSGPATAFLATACLAGCTQTAAVPPVPAVAVAVPGAAALPAGEGCRGDIARFRAVLASDVETGNVDRAVFTRAEPEIARADAACAAGRDGEARTLLASTRSRSGYR